MGNVHPKIRFGYRGQAWEIVCVMRFGPDAGREQIVAFTDHPEHPKNQKRMQILSMIPSVRRVIVRRATVKPGYRGEAQL